MTPEELIGLCVQPELWAAPLTEAMEFFEINTRYRRAMFIAQCAHESGRFAQLEENLNYSADGLLLTWPNRFNEPEAALYARRPEVIANRVYAKRNGNGDEKSGDGWRYRGRGPLQVTGRTNYAACGCDTGLPLMSEPERLATPVDGAFGSAWFWWKNGCNEVADEGDYTGVSGIINRGDRHKAALHLEERRQWLEKTLRTIA